MSETNEQALPLVIRLFGVCEVWVEGVPLPRLRSRQGLWLLALLALRQDRNMPRTWLQATLWPDSLPEKAAYNLRRTLSDLRGALGTQAVRILSPTPQTLRLDLNEAELDTHMFDCLRKRGDMASLEQAAQCYRGPLLAECGEEWVLEERAFRQEAYLTILETLAAQAERHGDPAAAIPYLRRIIAADALRESAHRQLMRALAQTGAYGAAVQVFRDLRFLLREQFPQPHAPVMPDTETILCYRDIRREARRKASLSETQKREASTRFDTQPAVAPALASTPRPRHNLPRERTTFIGREKEIIEAGDRLKQASLLTLTGLGGAGKTRLAQQIAFAQLDAYPDGAWLVELSCAFRTVSDSAGHRRRLKRDRTRRQHPHAGNAAPFPSLSRPAAGTGQLRTSDRSVRRRGGRAACRLPASAYSGDQSAGIERHRRMAVPRAAARSPGQ